jgi:hypothetical protein
MTLPLHYKSVPGIAQPSDCWPRSLVRTVCELKITFPVEEGLDDGNVGVHATHFHTISTESNDRRGKR